MGRLFFAVLPQSIAAGWLYYRTWMMELEWNAQWSQYVTGFTFFVVLLSIFLTLFIFPIPKKMVPKVREQKIVVQPTQKTIQTPSPYRGYSYQRATKEPFSLQALWRAIKALLRKELLIP